MALADEKTGIRIRKPGVLHRQIKRPGHPIAPPSGLIAVARLMLYEKIGPGAHPCHWCGREVAWMPGCGLKSGALICDHLDFDPTNDVPENLVPACNICNRHRLKSGKRAPISEDELYLVSVTSGLRTRATKKNCELCNKEFVVRISEIKIGRGRFCSMSCARRSRGRRKRD